MKHITKVITIIILVMVMCIASAESNRQSTYKVAGVTYANEDGSSRQDNIAVLMDTYGEWSDIPGSLVEYTYEDRPAIYVMAEDKCIGNIPSEDVETVLALMPDANVIVRTSSFTPDDGDLVYYARVTLDYPDTTKRVPNSTEPYVWITPSGSKYHKNSACSKIKNAEKVSLSEAVANGYEPCKRCVK